MRGLTCSWAAQSIWRSSRFGFAGFSTACNINTNTNSFISENKHRTQQTQRPLSEEKSTRLSSAVCLESVCPSLLPHLFVVAGEEIVRVPDEVLVQRRVVGDQQR